MTVLCNPTRRWNPGDWLVARIVAHPRLALLAAVLVLAGTATGLPHLKADFSYRIWFHDDDPHLARFDAFERRFGNDEAAVVVVHSPSGLFDRSSAHLLRELTRRMWQVPEVVRVESLANFNWVHADRNQPDELVVEPIIPEDGALDDALLDERRRAALTHPTLPGLLVSRDGTSALAYAWLQPGVIAPPDHAAVIRALRALVDELARRDARSAGDHSFHLAGMPAMTMAFEEANAHDFGHIMPLVLLLCITVLYLMFRSVGGTLLPLGTAAAATLSALAVAGHAGIELDNITFVMPEFLIAVAMFEGVHIMAAFFHCGLSDRRAAAAHALRKNLVPTLFTSATTAIGFLSFAATRVEPIAHLGLLSGIGTLYAWLYTYLLLGPLLVLLPLRRRGRRQSGRGERTAANYVHLIHRWRWPVLVGFALLTAASGWLAAQNRVDSDPHRYLPADHWFNRATDLVQQAFGHAMGIEIVVDSGAADGIMDPRFLRTVERFQEWLATRPTVAAVTSFVDVIKETNRALHRDDPAQYRIPATREQVAEEHLVYTLNLPAGQSLNDRVSLRNDALRITVRWGLRQSVPTLAEVEHIERTARSFGLSAHVTGKTLLYQQLNPYVVDAFLSSLVSSIACMILLLCAVLRSLRTGLLALVPNIVPLFIGAGLLALWGKTLDAGTVVVFATCLGIAVDDTIHFLSHYRDERDRGADVAEAVRRVFIATGPGMLGATAILVSAFACLSLSVFMSNRYFGVLIAVILCIGLAVDALLLPAMLLLRVRRADLPPRDQWRCDAPQGSCTPPRSEAPALVGSTTAPRPSGREARPGAPSVPRSAAGPVGSRSPVVRDVPPGSRDPFTGSMRTARAEWRARGSTGHRRSWLRRWKGVF